MRPLYLTSLAISCFCLFLTILNAQITITSETIALISTCGPNVPVTVCIDNDSEFALENENILIELEDGLEYIPQSLNTSIITEQQIQPLSKPSLRLTKLNACEKICFTFYIKYNCEESSAEKKIKTTLSNKYSTECKIYASSPLIEINQIEIIYEQSNFQLTRKFRISNFGTISIPQFIIIEKGNRFIHVLKSNFGSINDPLQTLSIGTQDLNKIGNKNKSFDPGEILEIVQEIKIDSCITKIKFAFDIELNCKLEICRLNIPIQQSDGIKIDNPILDAYFRLLPLSDSYCDTFYLEAQIRNSININPYNAISNIYNINFDLGWLNNERNNNPILFYNGCMEMHEVIVGNQKINLTRTNLIYPLLFTGINMDPDGSNGLSDLDKDGQFDDLAPGDTIKFILKCTANKTCINYNCNQNLIFPVHTPAMKIKYENYCRETFMIDYNDRTVFKHWNDTHFKFQRDHIHPTIQLSNHTNLLSRLDTFVVRISNNPFFSKYYICSNPKIRYKIKFHQYVNYKNILLSKGQISNRIDSIDGVSFEAGAKDTIYIPVEIDCDPNYQYSSPIDSTQCTKCVNIYKPTYFNTIEAEAKCDESCNEWITLGCPGHLPFNSICDTANQFTNINEGSLQIKNFQFRRTSLGYKDATMSLISNPNTDNLNLKSISTLDTFEVKLHINSLCDKEKLTKATLQFYFNYYYTSDRIEYFPFEFYDQEINFYKNSSAPLFTKNLAISYAIDTFVRFGNNNRAFTYYDANIFSNTPFANSSLNEFDSIIIYLKGYIPKNNNYPNGLTLEMDSRISYYQKKCYFSYLKSEDAYFINDFYYFKYFRLNKFGRSNMLNNYVEMIDNTSLKTYASKFTHWGVPRYNYGNVIFDYYDNEFRVPVRHISTEFTLPDYIEAVDSAYFKSSIQSLAFDTLNLQKKVFEIKNQYFDILKGWNFKPQLYGFELPLKINCFIDKQDSITTKDRFVNFQSKRPIDQEDTEFKNTILFKLPGLSYRAGQLNAYNYQDTLAEWNLELSSPSVYSVNTNSYIPAKIYNVWFYIENKAGTNKAKSLQLINEKSQKSIHNAISIVGKNAWMIQIDSLEGKNLINFFADINSCEKDSFKILIGNSCSGFPKDLDSVPTSCIKFAPQFTLYVEPKPAIFDILTIDSTNVLTFSKCDTFTQKLKITNVGIGYARNIRVVAKIPNGIKLTNCSFQHPKINSSIQSLLPIYNMSTMEYYIDIPSTFFTQNFAGLSNPDSSSFYIQFNYSIDCDLENLSIIETHLEYNNMCGGHHVTKKSSSPIISFIQERQKIDFAIEYEWQKPNTCTDTVYLKVILDKSSQSANNSQRLTLTFDKKLNIGNSNIISANNIDKNSSRLKTIGDYEVLSLNINDNMRIGDSAFVIIPIRTYCLSKCIETSIKIDIETELEIECVNSTSGKCKKYISTQNELFKDSKLFPLLRITKFEVEYLKKLNQFQFAEISIAIQNESKIDFHQNINLKLIHDTNGNQKYDSNDKLINTWQKNIHFGSEETIRFQDTFALLAIESCPLLLVLNREDNLCLCHSDTASISTLKKQAKSINYKICESDSLYIDLRPYYGENLKIDWTRSPYLFKTNDTSAIFFNNIKEITTSTFYFIPFSIFLTDQCKISDTVFIEKISLDPKYEIVTDLKCHGDRNAEVKIYDFLGDKNLNYKWNTLDTISVIKGIGAGTYQATITNEQNCSENIQITITEPLKFVLSLSSGTNYNNYDISCFGRKDGEIQISATGQQGNLEYFLNNNKVNIPLQKLGAGQHIIKLKDEKNCIAEDTILLQEPKALSLKSIIANPKCVNDRTGSIILNVTGGIGTYEYNWNDGKIDSTRIGLPAGVYYVEIMDKNGCTIHDTFTIQSSSKQLLKALPEDTTIQYGESIQLNFDFNQIIKDISWSPHTFLSCHKCNNPISTPTTDIQYILSLLDQDGCQYVDTVSIKLIYSPRVYIPNTFSPNGDGLNDKMQLFGLEQIELIKELSIFNRWGELIYQIKNQDASLQSDFWDGSFKGSPVNPGVYIFIAEFKTKDQKIIKYSGDINLIR